MAPTETGVFWKNIQWNIDQIAVQQAQAEKVNGRAKSGYYKAAILLASSVVEALAYKLLEQEIIHLPEDKLPLQNWECFQSKNLWSDITKDGTRLAICKRRQPRFQLKRHTDFKTVNETCLKLTIFTHLFFKHVERVRETRNKIHLQNLDKVERSWTKKDLEKVSSVFNELIDKFN